MLKLRVKNLKTYSEYQYLYRCEVIIFIFYLKKNEKN